jgi:uncharacterized protein YbaP (TraB family)
MKLNLWRITLGLFLVFTAADVGAESSVWQVSSSRATVYLAGSCHVLRASDHPLPAEFGMAYQNSRRIILEAPLDGMEKPEYLGKLMQAAIYNDGTTLRQHISPAAYARAEAFCKERNYPLEQYQLFRPWMLTMTLTMLELARIGADSTNGVDQIFNEKAQQDGKIIGSLETVDQQIGFLTLMDESMGDEQIVETIDELRLIGVRGPDILSAWKKGDEARLEELNLQELKAYPKLHQALIVDRNKRWIKDIEGYLDGPENTMVIVGVAHLVGSNSVVDLLHKRGYKVAKLKK